MEQGEFLALLGPSGCGKSTLLRILAGLSEPDTGTITLDGEDVTRRPPWLRDIGLVFQSYALFPHMNVRQNVGFGLEMRKIRGAEAERRIDEALSIVSMRDFAARRPAELSGGQQQRIAIARAIAAKPRLLLLDEPLSNLDAVLRQSVRVELRELHERTGITTIMVTHDQAEALTMSDRVALMQGGRIVQTGRPEDIYDRPATPFAASFIGSPPASLLPLELAHGIVKLSGLTWNAPGLLAEITNRSGSFILALRPERLVLASPDDPEAIAGKVRTTEYMGAERLVHVEVGEAVAVVRLAGAAPAIGTAVGVVPKAIAGVYETGTGARIGP